MKILSKHKDYYDYYQGIFGMDMTKIYDRRKVQRIEDTILGPIKDEVQEIRVCLAGKKYKYYCYKGNFYYTPLELFEMYSKADKDLDKSKSWGVGGRWYRHNYTLKDIEKKWKPFKETNLNIEKREPLLMFLGRDKKGFVPILKGFLFYRIVEAKEIYIAIEGFMGWLVDNPPLPDKQSNIGKIEGHGFDLKKSFRHRK